MKLKRFEARITDENTVEISLVKKAGRFLALGTVAAVAVGIVGIYALVGGRSIPTNDEKTASTTTTATAEVKSAESQTTTTSQAVETWKKAGIEEYDLVLETVKATETTTTTTTAAKTTTKETAEAAATTKKSTTTTTTTAATTAAAKTVAAVKTSDDTSSADDEEVAIKSCSKTVYTSSKVNMREEPSTDGELITVLAEGEELEVTGYTDSWYEIKVDGEVGYCMKKYTTTEAPEAEEAEEETEEETSTDVISYTDEEFDMLCYVLQGEVGDCSSDSKIAVANVIINRVKSSSFPNTISGVLTQANQFTAISGYYNGTNTPSQSTIDCAKRALAGEDNTNGAVYYYAPKYCSGSSASWFESLTFCMEIDGQRFFK